jgi:hypothetical protein
MSIEKGCYSMKKERVLILTWAVLLLGVLGCNPKFIPNTEIPDSKENRDIIDFCERYRHAVEDQNIGLLLSLASERYFDNSGTPSGDDDMDREGLETVLKERFKSIDEIRYEIRYRDIYEFNGLVMVEYTYTTSFQYHVDEKKRWENKTADNRLELERVGESFLIVSGM